MVQSRERASATERELQAYTDELGIRHHAERLEANFGAGRALEVLEQVTRAIAARRGPVPLAFVPPLRKKQVSPKTGNVGRRRDGSPVDKIAVGL